jgi:superfamily I DNA/RNA helicase
MYRPVARVLAKHKDVDEGLGESEVPGHKPSIVRFESSEEEAQFFARAATEVTEIDLDGTVAILYRNHFIADNGLEWQISAALGSKAHVRCGAIVLTERKEVKVALEILSLLRPNSHEAKSLKKCVTDLV